MYLSIGGDFAVRDRTIVGVFDLDNASWSRHTRAYLRQAEEQGEVFAIAEDVPRAFVVTEEFGLGRTYLTTASSAAIAKRSRR